MVLQKIVEKLGGGSKTRGSSAPSADVHETAWIAPDAVVIGDVEIGENSSVWPGAVIRGDIGKVTIGENTNIQDNAVVHPNSRKGVTIGDNVTVAHGAVIDGCQVDNNVLIGTNVTALHHTRINSNTIIGAGSMLTPGSEVESNAVYSGNPAEKVRDLTEQDQKVIEDMARAYVNLKRKYE